MSSCSSGVVLNVGGNWNNGTNAGLWYSNGNNDASNSNTNIGGRLVFGIYFGWHILYLSVENGCKERFSRATASKHRQAKNKFLAHFALQERGIVVKRIGYLYDKICDIDNIKRAIINSARHKTKRKYVQRILADADGYADKIHEMLIHHTFVPNPPHIKEIYDDSSQKWRTISVPKYYPDQIIQWAMIQVLQEPVLERGMYRWSCGSVPGRGTEAVRKFIISRYRRGKKIKYTLKLDIKKFFPSVNHDALKRELARKIKDHEVLDLLGAIIDSGGEGLPIGYYTSQWLSNFLLERLDHFIKEQCGVAHYVRYVDDIVLMDGRKQMLWKALEAINAFLLEGGYGLTIKGNYQLWKTFSRPLDFVGYRFYRGYTLMRKRAFYRLTRSAKRIAKFGYKPMLCKRFLAYYARLKKTQNAEYYTKCIKPLADAQLAKKYISQYELYCREKAQIERLIPILTASGNEKLLARALGDLEKVKENIKLFKDGKCEYALTFKKPRKVKPSAEA